MKGEMRVLDSSGHSTLTWDTEVSDGPLDPEVVEAEFNRLVAEGHLAFATVETDAGAKENVQIRTFDPAEHQQVTMVPQFVGG